MYKDISISQRIERIGELLAKGVYLYLKEGKDTKEKDEENKNLDSYTPMAYTLTGRRAMWRLSRPLFLLRK